MIEERDSVTLYIEEMVANLSNPPTEFNCKIFKVADHLRKGKEEDYEPKILAIGPIHRGQDRLMNMENHKVRYLQHLRNRSHVSIPKLVEKLWEMKEYALGCYPYKKYDMDEFVGTLLLDGCFVIELLRKCYESYEDNREISSDGDSILKSETLSQIVHDLMLLENQLPFAILNMLFDMTKSKNASPYHNICRLVLHLVRDMFPWSNVHKDVLDPKEIHGTDHLLGLVYRCYFSFSTKTPSEGEVGKVKNSCININSASDLTDAGIRLKACKENRLILKGVVLEIPNLRVSVKTVSLVRNLMAYEQLCLDNCHHKHVTGYVFFMHSLIKSTKNAEILKRSGIISNFLGNDYKVYKMFEQLVTNFLWTPFGSSDIFEKLNGHCSRRRVKWMAYLWRDYFNSPWSLIKFLAAALLLLITVAQFAIAVATFKNSEDAVKVRIV